ncbi:GNAT family N-acetyltransferase [Pleomorphomonas sp. NRK KF1]|uniref:GNAT family N-acetyltransferase n=1 Tax=Pleomorphomonas sp. NRK KF1 TaxID=2943000 RepID=UPI0020448BB6|nr:GNAT family N-acetyltransferase [Pleomorphomonas sp. NRK KF1]MCM5554976.1 GNAT family N-acetyltransferase [Pleomorphomonas sp. NRK KF1]
MKIESLTIRAYDEAKDLHALSTIWFEASRLAHAFIGEQRLGEQRILIEEKYLPNAETWVACLEGAPVGFISLLGNFVGGLFVASNRQGHGIGRALIAHALALKGELELEVYTDNTQAVRFYRSLGFAEMSRRAEDDEGQPFENAHMRLTRWQ